MFEKILSPKIWENEPKLGQEIAPIKDLKGPIKDILYWLLFLENSSSNLNISSTS